MEVEINNQCVDVFLSLLLFYRMAAIAGDTNPKRVNRPHPTCWDRRLIAPPHQEEKYNSTVIKFLPRTPVSTAPRNRCLADVRGEWRVGAQNSMPNGYKTVADI